MVPRRDYRYEGLAFGGIVFGAAGAWLGWNLGCPVRPFQERNAGVTGWAAPSPWAWRAPRSVEALAIS